MNWLPDLLNTYSNWLYSIGLSADASLFTVELTLFIVSFLLFIAIDKLFIRIVINYLKKFTEKSKTQIDNILFSNKVFDYFLHIIPVYIWLLFVDDIFINSDGIEAFVRGVMNLYINYLLVRGVLSLLKSVNEIYESKQTGRKRSIKSYIQVFQLLIILIGLLVAISIIIEKDISFLLTGIGAFAAVLMLVFKDSILGFVGGIQISANDMLRPGDWVSVPNAGADGIVIDISLTTVKIQNWDKTISTVPTYSLVSGSFHNWRGMEESGGRRIKRHLNINIQSIKFCTNSEIEEYKKIGLIKDYLNNKEEELKKYNSSVGNDGEYVNGRHLTNVGIFRIYVEAYLKAQKNINPEMTFLIRQLQATEKGLPLEVYVFSRIQDWAEYENIQADIFDHLFAIIPEFKLQIFQNPSGADFRSIIQK